jgi:hypothetical protein
MLASALSLVALVASVSHLVLPASASTDPPFTFDLFTGPQVQDETSELSAPEVEYTTPGGIPSVYFFHIQPPVKILTCCAQ